MPSLEETQKIFWHLLTAPEGVEQGLRTLPERERRLPLGLDGLVVGDERLSARARLDVYANMYFYRLLDCLREDFPAVLAALGDDRFHNLVTDYLIAHPSAHPSLRWLGEGFPSILESHPESRERPFLPDLGRLEWAILDAFDAPDAEPISPSTLESVPPEAWADLGFELSPSLSLLDVEHAVDEAWKTAKEGASIEAVRPECRTIRVWRKNLRVYHRAIDPPEARAIRLVRDGEDFGTVCEAFGDEEDAPLFLARLLRGWVSEQLIVGIEPVAS